MDHEIDPERRSTRSQLTRRPSVAQPLARTSRTRGNVPTRHLDAPSTVGIDLAVTAAVKTYDVFLSHGSPDKDWVANLHAALTARGVAAFLDTNELEPGAPFPAQLSQGLRDSRFLALVLSAQSVNRPWVTVEWAAFQAEHGPLDRIVPIFLEAVEAPTILKQAQAIRAEDRDVERVADQLARLVARPSAAREIPLAGAKFPFVIKRVRATNAPADGTVDTSLTLLQVTDPSGTTRSVAPPWRESNEFGASLMALEHASHEAADTDAARAELHRHAMRIGHLLFGILFGTPDEGTGQTPACAGLHDRFRAALQPSVHRPVVEIVSDEDELLALPWELVELDGAFLVREGRIDLLRTTTDQVDPELLLREPDRPFDLVVTVSAPLGSGLDYEAESFRITKALHGECRLTPSELGAVDDLVQTIERARPRGAHFSGHGGPGSLVFEDDYGEQQSVAVEELAGRLRMLSTGSRPPFFYLASCHGNDPRDTGRGAESAAARLHREGVTQVVAYSGPIVDALSTRAEAALYRAIAEGLSTRDAVLRARMALACPDPIEGERHRPRRESDAAGATAGHSFPFAWAQLVLYHRGPDWPLGVAQAGDPSVAPEAALTRTFQGTETRKWLSTGFIGRRRELHEVRRRKRAADTIFVFQGLGGLGKSTLAFHTLPLLAGTERPVFDFWCQEAEQHADPLSALADQMLEHLGRCFGEAARAAIAQAVDRNAEDACERFALLLQVALQQLPGVVLYFDNLESLLQGPKELAAEDDPEITFAAWRDSRLRAWWHLVTSAARESGKLHLVASTRYLNDDLQHGVLPVNVFPTDALYRLMAWFPALRRLTAGTRLRLVDVLAGHPRAVEYLNDLLQDALDRQEQRYGAWSMPARPTDADLAREWAELVAPALPEVEGRLRASLLLDELWERVLDEPQRRMLFRMTLLRRPWEWGLMRALGESGEPAERVEARADSLARTSLVERAQVVVRDRSGGRREVACFLLHSTTSRFVRSTFPADKSLATDAHRRIGDHLETEARTSPWIETRLEAGYHLLQAQEVDRAYDLLGFASNWLQNRGRVREGLATLTPFLERDRLARLEPGRRGELLGTVGCAYYRLGDARKAIEYHEQALKISREIGDRQAEGQDLGNLGLAYHRLGDARKAIDYGEQALKILREIGDRHGEGAALGSLGLAYARLGEVRKAIDFYEQGLGIARETGDRRGEGATLGSVGSAYDMLGEVRRAIEYHERALEISREIGDRRAEGATLGDLGLGYAHLGEVRKAIQYHERALEISREVGDRRDEGQNLGNLGIAYADLGEVHKAIDFFEQELTIVRETGDRRDEGSALANLGNVYARLGQIETARAHLTQALAIGRAIEAPEIIQVAEAALRKLRE